MPVQKRNQTASTTTTTTATSPRAPVPSLKHANAWEKPTFTLKDVRDAVPAHCFKRDTMRSLSYVAVDVAMATALFIAATYIRNLPATWMQVVAWPAYWIAQGVVCTGIWVLAHECGHGAFSDSFAVNNSVGYVLHSFLLVPFYSWKFTHSKHHKANAHMTKDQVFVPRTRSLLEAEKLVPKVSPTEQNESIFEDAPLYDLFHIVQMLLVGWPAYILMNVSSQKHKGWQSHFRPDSIMFEPKQWFSVVLSDIGVVGMLAALVGAARVFGTQAVIAYYVIPYLFVNMWLVLITFLQHTDAAVPHFRDGEWNFLLGALSTVDRDYGILNLFHHHIGDTHVAHHMFSTMPHYHAQEATRAIKKVLGPYYLQSKTPIWKSLWTSYRQCRFVEDSGDVLWYKN